MSLFIHLDITTGQVKYILYCTVFHSHLDYSDYFTDQLYNMFRSV